MTDVSKAAYGRIDFGADFDNGWNLEGNFGLRYVETTIENVGIVGLPNPFVFDSPIANPAGNSDGVVQIAEIDGSCANFANTNPSVPLPGYCSLSDARKALFASKFTGEQIVFNQDTTFDHWLPSFNARLDVGNGLLFRFAVSKGIFREDIQNYRFGGAIFDNTNALRDAGANALENGPLFGLVTGNRNLRPVESWNYDLSAEWYFDDVGSVTISGFVKDIEGILNTSTPFVTFMTDAGTDIDVELRQPANSLGGTLKGFEIGYQQTYDFLPSPLDGLGFSGNYTYVDGGDFVNADLNANQGIFASLQPLAGISEHTVNATIFYEKGPFSARAAYNWRSEFLITARDDIFPYSPIWQEDTGQLDASIFFDVTDFLTVGVQGVNLLDEVTVTSQVVDFDGTRVTRSAFRNDRRFTFLARFDF